MVRVILVVHFYGDSTVVGNNLVSGYFIGQKLIWVEVPTTWHLGMLIELLGQGRKPEEFHGTAELPTAGPAFKAIKSCLEQAYDNQFRVDSLSKNDWRLAATVRVVEIKEGWPLEEPVIFTSF